MLCRGWCLRHRPTAKPRASQRRARSRYFALDFSFKEPGWFRGPTDRITIPDSDRLALPRPPNLDSQYPRVYFSCQEKNAKCREDFFKASISSGAFALAPSPTNALASKESDLSASLLFSFVLLAAIQRFCSIARCKRRDC